MENPNWSLLPADPLAFFKLDPQFDRKALKRAYGRLIKNFKPETHPQEFQQIRQAYEELESQNRYGIRQAKIQELSQAWDIRSAEAPSDRSGPAVQVETETSVEAAIADPKRTYKLLLNKERKSPQEFFILATLCDLVDREKKDMYVKWLLTGLKEHPTDPGLQRLIAEYLAAFSDASSAPAALITLSRIARGSDFYPMTEGIWDRLLEDADFSVVANTLKKCEANLKHRDLRPKIAFSIHFLKRAMWKAPQNWTHAQIQFLESNGAELSYELEHEVELISLIHQYIINHREAVQRKPLGKTIDELIEVYCQTSADSLQRASSLCDELARNGNGMIDSFRFDADSPDDDVLSLCNIIVAEISFETGLDFGKQKRERLEKQADTVVRDIERSLESVGRQITLMRYRHFGFPFLAIWLTPLIISFGWQYWGYLLAGWSPIAILLSLAVVNPFFLANKADTKTQNVILEAYRGEWRPRLFRYVQSCHAPANDSISQLRRSGYDLGQGDLMDAVLSYAFADHAMQLFSRLQLFVH